MDDFYIRDYNALKKTKERIMNINILFILHLFIMIVYCSEIVDYEKIQKIVNEADGCSSDDVDYMNNYINKLYWIWTDNFFRYLRIKTYIYENEEIYESINNNIIINNSFNNISGLFNDNFIQYKQRDEYTRRALLILSNEQSLKKFIRKHVPKRKIKFFQKLSTEKLLKLLSDEKKNLINSYEKYKMFDQFRDVANSKYYYQKELLDSKSEIKTEDNIYPDKKNNPKDNNNNNNNNNSNNNNSNNNNSNNNNNNNINNNYLVKNVLTLDINNIPVTKELYFDYYDNNKWNKYFYSDEDEDKLIT
ncbi:hypothetical protein PFMALIP_01494 [Plasmodium falciparum MaliPS096_E11]|uniref:Uncharacterized protein n=1 Tax=Plasmodium falciparum MaliPS096_E11 TaxID=1036727 RepID=A0A024WU55_PLAFA|nr:hypothetical protein PFMALIP_01494 [Plasmodium falciparum MaliPS096_E11]